MGVEPYLIASTLICVLSQRLVRRLCDKCKQKYEPPVEMFTRIGLNAQDAKTITFYKAVGCAECLNTGYKGRLAIFELMEVNDEIAKLIVQRSDASVIRQKALQQGLTLLGTDGVRMIRAGATSIEEVLSVAYVEEVVE